MAAGNTTIKIRRSSVQNKAPTTTDLALGELAINTYDGKLFLKKSVNGTESIVALEKQLTAGTGVTITSGAINIGQDISTSVSPTFAGATLNGVTSIIESGTGAQNTLTVAGAGTGSLFAVGVSDAAGDGITLKSLTSDSSASAKLTLSGSPVILKAGTKQLTFNSSGNIVLPANGDILDSANVSVLKFPKVERVLYNTPIVDSNLYDATYNPSGKVFYSNATATDSSNNYITVDDSSGFVVGNPVTFFGTIPLGGILSYKVYYIRTIPDANTVTVTETQGGSTDVTLYDDSGTMIICAMSTSSYQTQRAPRQWTNYDSLETTGYDYSSITFGDTWFDDSQQKIFIYVNLGDGTPQPIDIT